MGQFVSGTVTKMEPNYYGLHATNTFLITKSIRFGGKKEKGVERASADNINTRILHRTQQSS